MNLINKTIGVWGLGVAGKGAIAYIRSLDLPVSGIDRRNLTQEEEGFVRQNKVTWYQPENLEEFLQKHDVIIPSPGIDLRPYAQFKHKWCTELDLFAAACKKPIIAITGSVAKTTVTTLLSQIIAAHGIRVLTGGNIGIPMLELIQQTSHADVVILEVSSFQLEHCSSFAPDIAVITNIYPNHLDRHDSFEQYQLIKLNISRFQSHNQSIILPHNLQSILPHNLVPTPVYFSHNAGEGVMRRLENEKTLDLSHFPPITYQENWTIICCVLSLLTIPLSAIDNALPLLKLPEHRLEYVGTFNGVDVYNDSKSTTPQSTQAAIERLRTKPIILLLGGIGKGVDRTPLIQSLVGKVKQIVCFGKEATHLKTMCDRFNISASVHDTLESAVQEAQQRAQPGEQIVLSPAGASYDLFKNYEERGKYFKQLITTDHQKHS